MKTYIASTSIDVIVMSHTDHVLENVRRGVSIKVLTVSLGQRQDLSFLKGVRGTISICEFELICERWSCWLVMIFVLN